MTASIIAIGVLALIFGWWWRRRQLVALESELAARLPRGPDGIIVGASPIDLPLPGAPAVLVLHGWGDTPQSVHYLAEGLHAAGYAVLAPLLPGHGRGLADFQASSAEEWITAARYQLATLRSANEWVGLTGLSMGGALAVTLAADDRDLPALALISPYLVMPPAIALAARLAPLWGPVVPAAKLTTGKSIRDPAERARSLAHGVSTPAALHGLLVTQRTAFAALPRVRAPTLVIQSREDNRISVRACEQAFARLGATDKRLEWIEGAAHVITVDYGRDQVIRSVIAWMDRGRGGA